MYLWAVIKAFPVDMQSFPKKGFLSGSCTRIFLVSSFLSRVHVLRSRTIFITSRKCIFFINFQKHFCKCIFCNFLKYLLYFCKCLVSIFTQNHKYTKIQKYGCSQNHKYKKYIFKNAFPCLALYKLLLKCATQRILKSRHLHACSLSTHIREAPT